MILVKTAAGQQVLKDRSMELTQRQRTALIMIDGRRDLMEVMQATGVVGEDVKVLVQLGLVADSSTINAPTEPAPLSTRPRPMGAR